MPRMCRKHTCRKQRFSSPNTYQQVEIDHIYTVGLGARSEGFIGRQLRRSKESLKTCHIADIELPLMIYLTSAVNVGMCRMKIFYYCFKHVNYYDNHHHHHHHYYYCYCCCCCCCCCCKMFELVVFFLTLTFSSLMYFC